MAKIKFRVITSGQPDIDALASAHEGVPAFVGHGCNREADMGGGVARYLADKYPSIEKVDANTPAGLKLARGFSFSDEDMPYSGIYNIYSQQSPGAGTFQPDALLYNLSNVIRDIVEVKIKDEKQAFLYLPFIGTGVAGGDPSEAYLAIKVACEYVVDFIIMPREDFTLNVVLCTWGVQVDPAVAVVGADLFHNTRMAIAKEGGPETSVVGTVATQAKNGITVESTYCPTEHI